MISYFSNLLQNLQFYQQWTFEITNIETHYSLWMFRLLTIKTYLQWYCWKIQICFRWMGYNEIHLVTKLSRIFACIYLNWIVDVPMNIILRKKINIQYWMNLAHPNYYILGEITILKYDKIRCSHYRHVP